MISQRFPVEPKKRQTEQKKNITVFQGLLVMFGNSKLSFSEDKNPPYKEFLHMDHIESVGQLTASGLSMMHEIFSLSPLAEGKRSLYHCNIRHPCVVLGTLGCLK